MANEENQDADKASWTIKSMPVETRKLAVACAAKSGEQMATWLDRAVRTQARLEAGERVLPPARTAHAVAMLPAVYPLQAPELSELAALMEQARALAAQAELPIPKTAVRHALALMTAQLRAARGLPPLAPRQTKSKNGQTVEHDGVS
jgi:hypothetical protein